MLRNTTRKLRLELLEDRNAPGNLWTSGLAGISSGFDQSSLLRHVSLDTQATSKSVLSGLFSTHWFAESNPSLPQATVRTTSYQEPLRTQAIPQSNAFSVPSSTSSTLSQLSDLVIASNAIASPQVSAVTDFHFTSGNTTANPSFNAEPSRASAALSELGNLQSPGSKDSTQATTQPAVNKEVNKDKILASIHSMPISFEANVGQVNSTVDYITRSQGYNLFLNATTATLDIHQATGGRVIQMELVGGNVKAIGVGLDRQEGTTNYLAGSDSSAWHTNVANYGRVAYQGVYPGIDAVYYGDNQQQLEYDFVVAPGAHTEQIRLQFAGADGLSIDQAGNLVLETGDVDLVQKAPVIYQEIDGQRIGVSGSYQLLGNNQVGFTTGKYDHNQPLVIDPVVTGYNSYLGGSNLDAGYDIAVDSSGNAFVVGTTSSANLPTTPGAYLHSPNLSSSYFPEHFVSKLNSTGTAFSYVTHLGANWNYGDPEDPTLPGILPFEAKPAIVVDSSGNAIVTGATVNPSFPFTTYYGSTFGNAYAFVVKLNSTGSGLIYSISIGGTSSEGGSDIALDSSGNVYLTGLTKSSDFMSGYCMNSWPGVNSSYNGYAVKLTSSGLVSYARYLPGNTFDRMNGIAVNGNGEAVIVGQTLSTDCAVNALYPTAPQGQNGIVTKLNSLGGTIFSTYLGGSGNDIAQAVAYDASGNIYVVGQTDSTDFPIAAAYQATKSGGTDAFLTKFNSSGNALVYSTYLGGSGTDIAYGVAVNSSNQPYLVGSTNSASSSTSTGFPVLNTQYNQLAGYPSGSYTDAFVTRFNSSANALLTSTYYGTPSTDVGRGIALNGTDVYITGSTDGSGFATAGAAQTAYAGNTDAFMTKFNSF